MSILSELRNFFDNILQLDDIIALLNVIPYSLKVTILAGVGFSSFIAAKRAFIG